MMGKGKKLVCVLSALIALGFCTPVGTTQALAYDAGGSSAQSGGIAINSYAESSGAAECSNTTNEPSNIALAEYGSSENADASSSDGGNVPFSGSGSAGTAGEANEETAGTGSGSSSTEAGGVQGEPKAAGQSAENAANGSSADSQQPDVEASAPDTPSVISLLSSSLEKRDASGFHATITSNKDSYSAGSTAIYSVKYTIDQGAFKEGDTITVSVPQSIASKVKFSVDPLHFASAKDNGDGTWSLTFGSNAGVALSGSFSMYITTANVTDETTAPVTVGGASKNLTVIPTGSASGVGTYTDAIMKDASDSKVSYGDYDYSEGYGDNAAQIGVYDSTNDETIKYRLFTNDKQATMSNITVVDTLPDGMTFNRSKGVVVEDSTGATIDSSLYSVSISGQQLTFSYPGTTSQKMTVVYWVDAKGGQNIKYTNRAEISYSSQGKNYQEHRNYVLQGNNYNAACGEKSVDKTVITSGPNDQMVTYSIKFWNNNGFAAGDINLTDTLDSHVKFVYADQNDKFNVTYDAASNSVRITNTAAISGSDTEYVRFVTDFTDVPEGYTVENSVGGNTTKTLKMSSVQLSAEKTIDGAAPADGQTFTFQLCDQQGNVLQEKQNSGSSVNFDKIYYSEDDLNADGSDSTINYTVKELGGTSTDYVYDTSSYDVAVTLHKGTDANGKTTVTATPVITKDGAAASSLTFDNKSNVTSITGTKVWTDGENQDGVRPDSVTIGLLADGADTGTTTTATKDGGWKFSFDNLAKYDATDGHEISYSVAESNVPSGYKSEVSGDAASGFVVTNTHQPETTSVAVTKTWSGETGGPVTIHLLSDGADTGSSLTLSEDNGWTSSFTGLAKYRDGGTTIVYTVTEDSVDGYKTSISGDQESGFTITNTKEVAPEKPDTPDNPTPVTPGGDMPTTPTTPSTPSSGTPGTPANTPAVQAQSAMPKTADASVIPLVVVVLVAIAGNSLVAVARRRASKIEERGLADGFSSDNDGLADREGCLSDNGKDGDNF